MQQQRRVRELAGLRRDLPAGLDDGGEGVDVPDPEPEDPQQADHEPLPPQQQRDWPV